MNKKSGQNKDDAGPGHIPAEIGCNARYHSTQDTVVRITEQTSAGFRRFTIESLAVRCGRVTVFFTIQFLRFSHTGNYLFYLFNSNHL